MTEIGIGREGGRDQIFEVLLHGQGKKKEIIRHELRAGKRLKLGRDTEQEKT